MIPLTGVELENSRKVLVAVIDGNSEHRGQVTTALTSFYRVAEYREITRAIAELAAAPPCVVLLDEQASPHGGGDAVRAIRRALGNVPIICTSPAGTVLTPHDIHRMGADSFLAKPFRRSTLLKSISGLVNRTVEADWEKLAPLYQQSLRNTVDVFNNISDMIDKGEPVAYHSVAAACTPLVEAVSSQDFKVILRNVKGHDNYSYVHSLRVATLLSLFGYTIGLKGEDLNLLASGGLIHDIGKMEIPHQVLNKPGKLSDEEWLVMRSHVDKTLIHLADSANIPKGVLTIAAQHHEKLDGTGYPSGLKNGQLNELARMASIVDVFSALTDRRCYKPPMDPEKALTIMVEEMGGLDRGLLALFRAMLLDAVTDDMG